MTEYTRDVELRRLYRARALTGIIGFVTALAFVLDDSTAAKVTVFLQATIWLVWALGINADIKRLKQRIVYVETRVMLDGLIKRDVQ